MNNIFNHTSKEYQLLSLKEKHIKILYNWNINEKHFELYTCRPLKSKQSFDEYSSRTLLDL